MSNAQPYDSGHLVILLESLTSTECSHLNRKSGTQETPVTPLGPYNYRDEETAFPLWYWQDKANSLETPNMPRVLAGTGAGAGTTQTYIHTEGGKEGHSPRKGPQEE